MARAFCRSHLSVLAAGVLLLIAAPLQAGPIFIAGKLDGEKFTAAKDAASCVYCVRYSTTGVAGSRTAA